MFYYDHVNNRAFEDRSTPKAVAAEILWPAIEHDDRHFDRLDWSSDGTVSEAFGESSLILTVLDFENTPHAGELSFEQTATGAYMAWLKPYAFSAPLGTGDTQADAAWDLWQKYVSGAK